MITASGFKMTFDTNATSKYPHGYWYVITDDGSYDATGDTPLNALAQLSVVLTEALREHNDR